MNNRNGKRLLCLIVSLVLILGLVGCADSKDKAALGEEVSFTLVVTDAEGAETSFAITTDKATVGEALLEEGLIEGEDSEFGLYITTVNGVTLDWDKDQKYWAFYIDGEYAQTGVDSTDVVAGTVYSLVAEG